MQKTNKNSSVSGILGISGIGLIVIAGIYFLLVTSPFFFRLPSAGLDASWALGVEEVRSRGLQFGEDIVFTYGPYIGVATHNYSEYYYPGNLWIGLLISAAYAFHFLILTQSKNHWFTALALIALASALSIAMDPIFMSFPLIFLLASIRLVRNQAPSAWKNTAAILGGLTVGILPLIKVSFIAICLAGILMLIGFLLRKNEWKMACIAGLSALCSFVFFWLMAGQALLEISNYLLNSLLMISGYSDGMASYGSMKQIVLYLVASLVLVTGYYLAFAERDEAWPTVLLLAAFIFLSFKAAFVRHDDGHLISAYASLWVLLIVFLCINQSWMKSIVVFLVVLVMSTAIPPGKIETLPKLTFEKFRDIPIVFSDHLTEVPRRHYEISMENIKREFPLPALEGTVDIYSYEQARLIASDNSWNPRPVFQSYTVLTPALAEMNRQHLLQENAPDNLIFKLQAIDNRFPTLEDGPSLPWILKQYHARSFFDDFIHFEKHGNSFQEENFSEMPETVLQTDLGNEIEPPWENGMIFVTIETSHSLAGKAMSFLYKTGGLQMSLRLDDGTQRIFRLPRKMAAAGFIMSPLIENSEEFWQLAIGEELHGKRITGFFIIPETHDLWWENEVEIHFRQIE